MRLEGGSEAKGGEKREMEEATGRGDDCAARAAPHGGRETGGLAVQKCGGRELQDVSGLLV